MFQVDRFVSRYDSTICKNFHDLLQSWQLDEEKVGHASYRRLYSSDQAYDPVEPHRESQPMSRFFQRTKA